MDWPFREHKKHRCSADSLFERHVLPKEQKEKRVMAKIEAVDQTLQVPLKGLKEGAPILVEVPRRLLTNGLIKIQLKICKKDGPPQGENGAKQM